MDTQFDPLMVPPGTVQRHTAASHTRAQTTRTEQRDWQFGIVRRVELEERAYVAAKGLARLKDLAIHASLRSAQTMHAPQGGVTRRATCMGR